MNERLFGPAAIARALHERARRPRTAEQEEEEEGIASAMEAEVEAAARETAEQDDEALRRRGLEAFANAMAAPAADAAAVEEAPAATETAVMSFMNELSHQVAAELQQQQRTAESSRNGGAGSRGAGGSGAGSGRG